MPFDPTVLSPLPPGAGLPARLPFGPNSRYAAVSDAELLAAYRRLLAGLALWCEQGRRFQAVGVTAVLGGPCARALLEAHGELADEIDALRVALQVRLDQIRRAAAAVEVG